MATYMNRIKVHEVNDYANIVFIHFWQLCVSQIIAFCTIFIYYSGHEQLRNEIGKIIKSFLQKIKLSWSRIHNTSS